MHFGPKLPQAISYLGRTYILLPDQRLSGIPAIDRSIGIPTLCLVRSRLKFRLLKWPWVKSQIVPPVNITIPTKLDQDGWCTYPKMVSLVLTHSQLSTLSFSLCGLKGNQSHCWTYLHIFPGPKGANGGSGCSL